MLIHEAFQPSDIEHLVDVENATASRQIFCDPGIWRMELQRIFTRTWLFVGHTSEIPNPGDYVTRLMGNDPVILVRDAGREIRVLHNSCTHRGSLVCRATSGNARGFTCPYHGWVFDNSGAIQATAMDDELYKRNLDFHQFDLKRARVGTYGDLIFATWNEAAISLDDYLGDARWYLDIMFHRTPNGMEVLGAPHRWVSSNNWKLGPMNFGADGPHAVKVHGPITDATFAGGGARQMLRDALIDSPSIRMGNGHNGIWTQAPEQFPPFLGWEPPLIELFQKTLKPEQLQLMQRAVASVSTIFPNFSWVQGPASFEPDTKMPTTFLAIRNWQPIAPNRTEVWNWFLVEQEASEAFKEEAMRMGVRTFSAGGTFDQDDAEAWHAIQRGVEGEIGRTMDVSFEMALAYRDRPLADFPGPGTAYPSNYAEVTEFDVLVEWQRYMSGKIDWAR